VAPAGRDPRDVLKRPRLVAAGVVGSIATIAACFALKTSTMSQSIAQDSPTTYNFNGVKEDGTGVTYGPITVSAVNTGDHEYITSIVFTPSCPDFHLRPGLATGGGTLVGSSDGGLYSMDSMSGPLLDYKGCGGAEAEADGGTDTGTCTPDTYTFSVTFAPTIDKGQTCTAIVTTTAGTPGSNSQTAFTGYGIPPAYKLTVSPLMMTFNTPAGSTSGSQTVTVSNQGSQMIDVTITAPPSPFAVVPIPPLSLQLAAGSASSYAVSCGSNTAAMYVDTFSFTTGAGQGGFNFPVALSCNVYSATISLMSSPTDFGTNDIGGPKNTQSLTIKNTGSNPVGVSGFGLMNAPHVTSTDPSGGSLGSNSTVTATLVYTPTAGDTSGDLGNYTFTAGGDMIAVPLTGTTLPASLGTSPNLVDFGTVCAGGSGSAVDVTVSTNAAAPVMVGPLMPPSTPFGATANLGSGMLVGNGSGSVVVHTTVKPSSSQAPGMLTSMFTLGTDMPGSGASLSVPMQATVLANSVAPTPASLSFGAVMVTGTSEGQMVTLTNCGSGDLTVIDGRLTGAAPTQFAIEAPANAGTLNKTLHVGDAQQFLVQMTPNANGNKTATLLIETDSSTNPEIEVPLDGNAFGGSNTSPASRETYYACSVGGHGAAAWPIAVACAWLARRRRRR